MAYSGIIDYLCGVFLKYYPKHFDMKVSYYGHSCFQIDIGEYQLLLDPFISGNPLATHIDTHTIKPSHIILSHGHGDHVMDAEAIAKQSGAMIISNFEIVSWYETKGIPGHGMNHGGWFSFPFGSVKCVNAIHSSVLPDGTYGGNPCGFVVRTGGKQFYFAGDTALHHDMKLIPTLCGKLDFAILPIGSNFTMDIQEAIIASQFIECNEIIGCHYDTFPPIKIDHAEAIDKFKKAGVNLHLVEIGKSIEF